MMRRQGISDNPVLIGAGAILVTLVMVLLSYNANEGLPFVPTYNIKAEVPGGANVVTGNDVRIGGARVGLVSAIEPKRRGHDVYAVMSLKLDEKIGPIPADSKIVVRPKSTIGLKYIQLTLGSSDRELPDGGTLPISQSIYASEFEDLLNTFDKRVREGNRKSLYEFGNAFAGRGADLNTAIGELVPLFENLEPVARTISDPAARFGDFIEALTQATVDTAAAGSDVGDLFANADRTFGALATATKGIQDTLVESPPTLDVTTDALPESRPFIRQLTGLVREFKPGAKYLPAVADDMAAITTKGTPAMRHLARSGGQFSTTFRNLGEFAGDPQVQLGVKGLVTFARVINDPLAYITPAQSVCNYAGLFARNIASATSQRDGIAGWLRIGLVGGRPGPNSELGPASSQANFAEGGNNPGNVLRSNPYPNTASPGQPSVCAAGNEPTGGRKNPPTVLPNPVNTYDDPTLPSGTRTEDTKPISKAVGK